MGRQRGPDVTGVLLQRGPRHRRPAAVTFTASNAIIANPGRGFFQYSETHYQSDGSGYSPLNATTLASARTTQARTIVFRYFVMEKFLTADTLDPAWLALVAADLAAVRAAGCKAVIRFAYSTSGSVSSPPYSADPPVARVLSHIAQLAATLNAAADVILAVQAGFVGMWGEWYYSDNFGDLGSVTTQQKNDRIAVLSALLTALNPSIFVQVRYVGVRRWAATAGLDITRIGVHNDALGSPFGNFGTFTTFTDIDEAATRAYLAGLTGVPVGGESAGVSSPGTDYASVAPDLAAHHWAYLNPDYHPDVLSGWGSTNRDEVDRRLGYRLRLTTATVPTSAPAGAPVAVSFTLANDGWSTVLDQRPSHLVFVDGATTVTRALTTLDLRTVAPGATTTVTDSVTAPTAGTWAMHLRFPDPAAGLAATAAYAIQLANTGLWDSATGRNTLGRTLVVT